MKTKKTHRANIERLRSLFIQAGFIIVLSFVLIAFEWSYPESNVHSLDLSGNKGIYEPEMINTIQEKPEVKPPEPKFAAVLTIVDEKDSISHEYIPLSTEVTTKTVIPIILPPDKPEKNVDEGYLISAEIMPTFRNGGLDRFIDWVYREVKYPEAALANNVQGRVTAQFVVNREGKVESIRILQSNDPAFSEEVKRVLSGSPLWEPGIQNGKFVRVAFVIPVVFKIQ